jgi:glycosyltransferase involved in cell wall biosynthesis
LIKSKIPIGILTDIIDQKGGAEKYAVDMTTNIDKEIFRPYFIATKRGGNLETTLSSRGIDYIIFYRNGWYDRIKSFLRLLRYIKKKNISLIHAHKSLYWAVLVKIFTPKIKIILHCHGGGFYRMGRFERIINKYFLNPLADIFVFNSKKTMKMYKNTVGIDNNKLIVIPNVIDMEHYRIKEKGQFDLRIEYDLTRDSILIGQVSRLVHNKDHLTLLKAFKVISGQFNNVYLFIIGDGPLRREIEDKIKILKLHDRVLLTGYRENIPEYLNALDIGVHASTFEGVPLAVLEYMSAGLPTVATDVGGIPDVIVDGETGFLVPKGDVKKLSDRLRQLIEDTELRTVMGNKSHIWIEENANYKILTAKLTELYNQAINYNNFTTS